MALPIWQVESGLLPADDTAGGAKPAAMSFVTVRPTTTGPVGTLSWPRLRAAGAGFWLSGPPQLLRYDRSKRGPNWKTHIDGCSCSGWHGES
jgi:hypothetical protein